MRPGTLPRDPATVLGAATVADGQSLTPEQYDLGGLHRVVATVTDHEVVLYGEFRVDAALLDGRDPAEVPHWGGALSGIVEDWQPEGTGQVTLCAFVHAETHEHGPLGLTLAEAVAQLEDLRVRCLAWLRSSPAA
ncbi:hypothetical protein MRU69_02200 [Kocuria flava]|uniref:hypothetical protein n=1 Tax=Kocuria flava TaxID=446860 RepID=UPI000DD4A83E|nr:hypothetical protein [Kocuria flava]MCJ8503677.1 hypothetical protein [Kocuria flava]